MDMAIFLPWRRIGGHGSQRGRSMDLDEISPGSQRQYTAPLN